MLMDPTVCLAAPMQNLRTSPRYIAVRPSQQHAFCSPGLGGCGQKIDAATQWAKSFGGRRESRTAQWLKPVQKRRSKNSFTPSASCHTSPLCCAALRRDYRGKTPNICIRSLIGTRQVRSNLKGHFSKSPLRQSFRRFHLTVLLIFICRQCRQRAPGVQMSE